MLVIIIIFQLFIHTETHRCVVSTKIPKYHLIESCHRSKLGIAARANYESLISCQRLGIEKKALAINFSPKQQRTNPVEYSCEVLKCAETEGGLSLRNDTRYNYYSIYGKPLPNVNSTCVPATGMFYLFHKLLNYTKAHINCNNASGVLADVTSEQRTDALAQVLSNAGVNAAYVGLNRMNSSTFYSINGNGLECSTYRAWAPGHPRRKIEFGCVVLTKQHTWITTKCKNAFPSLCELIPNGPYKKGSIFTKKDNEIKGSD